MKNRIISFIIAFVLVFTMAVPAFADNNALVCPYCGNKDLVSYTETLLGVSYTRYKCYSCGNWYNKLSTGELVLWADGNGSLLDKALENVTVGGGAGRVPSVNASGHILIRPTVTRAQWGNSGYNDTCLSPSSAYTTSLSVSGDVVAGYAYSNSTSPNTPVQFGLTLHYSVPCSGHMFFTQSGSGCVAYTAGTSGIASDKLGSFSSRSSGNWESGYVYTYISNYFWWDNTYAPPSGLDANVGYYKAGWASTSSSFSVDLSSLAAEFVPVSSIVSSVTNNFTYIDQSVTVNDGDTVYNYNNNYYYYDNTDNSTTIYYVDVESAVQSGAIVHIDADGSITITPAGAAAEPDPTPTPTPEATATPTPTPTATPDGGGTGTTDPTASPTAIPGTTIKPDNIFGGEDADGDGQADGDNLSFVTKLLGSFGWWESLRDLVSTFIADISSDSASAYALADGDIATCAADDGSTVQVIASTGSAFTAPSIPVDLSAAESPIGIIYGGTVEALDLSWYARYKPSIDALLSGVLWICFIFGLFRKAPGIIAGVPADAEKQAVIFKG